MSDKRERADTDSEVSPSGAQAKVPWHKNFILFRPENRGVLAVAGGFLIQFVLGSLYLWGTINTYVASYFKVIRGQDISVQTVNAVFPFIFQSGGIAVALTDIVLRRVKTQILCCVCSFFMVLAVFLSSFSPNFALYVMFYGVFYGFFQGLVLYPPIYNAYKYYPTRKGMVTGIIVCGFGLGNLALSQIAFQLINPNHEEYDQTNHEYPRDVSANLPYCLRMLSLTYACILTVGCALVRAPLEDPSALPAAEAAAAAAAGAGAATTVPQQEDTATKDDLSVQIQRQNLDYMQPSSVSENIVYADELTGEGKSEITRPLVQSSEHENYQESELVKAQPEPTFKMGMRLRVTYIIFIQAWAMTACGMMISSNYKPYAQINHIGTDGILATLGSLTSVSNAFGRPIFGLMLDRLPYKKIAMINFAAQILFITTLSSIKNELALYIIWVLMIFFFYGATYALIVPLTQKVYGEKMGKVMYRFIYQGFCLESWTQYFLVLYLKKPIGYDNIFYIFSGIAGTGLIVALFGNFEPVVWEKQFKALETKDKE